MIIHCTKKLATKLQHVEAEVLKETSPLGSWHANVYAFDDLDCLLFTHDETRYSLFFAGAIKPMLENIEEVFKHLFLESLAHIDIPKAQLLKVELAMGKISFDTHTNRSILSTMKNHSDMVNSKVLKEDHVLDIDIHALNYWLTDMFVSSKQHPEYWLPKAKMKELVTNL